MFVPEEYPLHVQEIVNAAKGAAGDDTEALTPEQRAATLAGLRQAIDLCESQFLATLASFDTNGDGEVLHGARSTAAWLKGALHLSPSDASQRVKLARELRHDLSVTVEPLASGRITFDQVRAIGSAIRALPTAAKGKAAKILTEVAEHTDAATLRAVGRQVRQTIDPDGVLADSQQDFERRYFHLSPMLDGMVAVDGLLDAEGATYLATALAPFLVPTSAADTRTTSQRRGDGLVDIARLAMEQAQLGELGGERPRLEVSCPLPTLLGAGGSLTATLPQTPGGPGLITSRQLERIGCDSSVARVLLGPDSVPVDVGRDQRLFSSAQRRALASRDGGCRFPRCHFPPALTDAHHIVSWLAGGQTSLDNGVLLCRFHHRLVHEHGWSIQPEDPVLGAAGRLLVSGPDDQLLVSAPGSALTLALTWFDPAAPPDRPG